MLFYYFLKRSMTGEMRELPICTDSWMGDISNYIEIDGVGYIIVDYAIEQIIE